MASRAKRLKTEHDQSLGYRGVSKPQTLQTGPISRFNHEFPYFRKPKEVGHFRQDECRQFVQEQNKSVKYLVPYSGPVEFDLKQGLDSFMRRDETVKEYIDDMLRWIMSNKSKFILQNELPPGCSKAKSNSMQNLSTDFVCWRGLLTKLLCTPYENREGWIIAVTKFRGTYYMCDFDTEERKASREKETEQQKVFTYGGYKFEQFMTTDQVGMKPNVSLPINNSEGFCSVVRSRLDQHSLVYGGEVDCCEDRESNSYIELKTSREIHHPNQLRNFKRFKLIKWWCQSFLLAIPKVVCGFRDDNSIVHSLTTYETGNIPKICKDIQNAWQPNVCFNFLNQFLDFVKKTVTKDDPKVAYVLTWQPRSDIQWRELVDSEYTFIPQWYVDSWTQSESNRASGDPDPQNG